MKIGPQNYKGKANFRKEIEWTCLINLGYPNFEIFHKSWFFLWDTLTNAVIY